MKQVHGAGVILLDVDTHPGQTGEAAVCTRPGQACTVLIADCLPVLFSDERGPLVAAAHVGWRGLARQQSAGLGVRKIYGNDGSAAWCTAHNDSRFFSYRRDGVCGRMAASI